MIETTAESSSLIVPVAVSVVFPTTPETTESIANSMVSVDSRMTLSTVSTRTKTPLLSAAMVTSDPPTAGIHVIPPSAENSMPAARKSLPLVAVSPAAEKSNTIGSLDGLDRLTSNTNGEPSIAAALSIVTSGAASLSIIVPVPVTERLVVVPAVTLTTNE